MKSISLRKISYHISRLGLGITFLWIGMLIFRNPVAWSGYVQSWAVNLLPIPLTQIMMGTAILDITIGIFLLLNAFVWLVALVGAIHVTSVLIVSGITDITVRDIAILYCALSLTVVTLPESIASRLPFLEVKD